MSASPQNRPSSTLVQLQGKVENTLMQLMAVIRKGDDASIQNILRHWLTMYHSIYKVTTEEDVPYDMYVMMIETVVQVLVVHVLSAILKEGCGKGLLAPTHHHGVLPSAEVKKKELLNPPKIKNQETHKDAVVVKESLRRTRGESEEEVLIVDPKLKCAPSHPKEGTDKKKTGSSDSVAQQSNVLLDEDNIATSISLELENTAIVRWSREYHNFRVFRKYTGSIFHYLNQYVTPGCGLEDVEVMCNKLFYSVVFEPTRALQLRELTKNMGLVLKEMMEGLVNVVLEGDDDINDDEDRYWGMRTGTSTFYETIGTSVSFLQDSQSAEQNTVVEKVWRRARAVLPTLRLDVRFLAVQQVLNNWSVFLDEVSGGTVRSMSGSTPITVVPAAGTAVHTSTSPPPLQEGTVKNSGGVRRIVLPSEVQVERGIPSGGPSTRSPSPEVGVNFRELERLQAFLALPPVQRRATPLPAISQDAYETTMRQLVATVCQMLSQFKPEVESQLKRLTLTPSKPPTTLIPGEKGDDNEETESWRHVLVRTLLWETAIRLLGPLWTDPDVSRSLSTTLSPPSNMGSSIIVNPQFSFQVLVKMWLMEQKKCKQFFTMMEEENGPTRAKVDGSVTFSRGPNTPAQENTGELLSKRPTVNLWLQDIEDGIHTISCMMKFSSTSRGMLSQATIVLSEMITNDMAQILLQYHVATGGAQHHNKRSGQSFLLDTTCGGSALPPSEETRGIKLVNSLSDVYALYRELNRRCLDGRAGIQNALEQAVRDILTRKNHSVAQRRHTFVSLPVKDEVDVSVSLPSPRPHAGGIARSPTEADISESLADGAFRSFSTRVFSLDATQVTDVLTPTRAGRAGIEESSPRPGNGKNEPHTWRGGSGSPNPDLPMQNSSPMLAPSTHAPCNLSTFRPVDFAKILVDYFFHYALLDDRFMVREKQSDSNRSEKGGEKEKSESRKSKISCEIEQHYASLAMWITVLQNSEDFSKYFKKRLLQRLLAPPSTSSSTHSNSVSVREESKRLLQKLVAASVPISRRTLVSWITLVHFLQPCVTKGEPLMLSSSATTSHFPSPSRPSPPLLSVQLFSRRHWPLPALLWSSHGGGRRGSSVGAGGSGSGGRTVGSSGGGGVLPGLTMPLPVQHAINRLVGKLSVSYPLRRMEWVHWKGYVVFSGVFPGSNNAQISPDPASHSSTAHVAVTVTTANVLQGALLFWINEATQNGNSVNSTRRTTPTPSGAAIPPASPPHTSSGQEVTGNDLAKKMGLSFADIQSQLQVLLEAGTTEMKAGKGLVVCRVPVQSAGDKQNTSVELAHHIVSAVAVENGRYVLNESFCVESGTGSSPHSRSISLMLPAIPHATTTESGGGRSSISGGGGGHKATRRYGQSKKNTPERNRRAFSTSHNIGMGTQSVERFPWNDRLQAFIMSLLKRKDTQDVASSTSHVTLSFSEVQKAVRSRFGNYVEVSVMKAALERLIEVGYVKRCADDQSTATSPFPPSSVGGGQHYTLVP